jgi:hypothetical protein
MHKEIRTLSTVGLRVSKTTDRIDVFVPLRWLLNITMTMSMVQLSDRNVY